MNASRISHANLVPVLLCFEEMAQIEHLFEITGALALWHVPRHNRKKNGENRVCDILASFFFNKLW
jgi:hypothetical protein